jgi:hypothetical protein
LLISQHWLVVEPTRQKPIAWLRGQHWPTVRSAAFDATPFG